MKKQSRIKKQSDFGKTLYYLTLTVKELVEEYVYLIDLDADYQRENVWPTKNKERLLDSIFRNIDIPKLYLAEVGRNSQFKYECVDGKQRILTLFHFLRPEKSDTGSVLADIMGTKYTFVELKKAYPNFAKQLEEFKLNFVIYVRGEMDEEFVSEIFRRLQLGIKLNSGEMLKSHVGTLRDFIFEEIGKQGEFLRRTGLSEKRFSRQFTLAQICINSFARNSGSMFVRARLDDLERFFEQHDSIAKSDESLNRIRRVLKKLDAGFGDGAKIISSRATAVSAYLFGESLFVNGHESQISQFANFYIQLLESIREDMKLVASFAEPRNVLVLEAFQKYVLQASVEPYSIQRRDEFLKKSFAYFCAPKTKGKIIGS